MRPTIGLVVVFLLGLALGIGGTLGVQAVTDGSTPSSPAEVRERLAEEWGQAYAECVEEAETPADDYFEEDDSTPAATTETERLECNHRADAVLRQTASRETGILVLNDKLSPVTQGFGERKSDAWAEVEAQLKERGQRFARWLRAIFRSRS